MNVCFREVESHLGKKSQLTFEDAVLSNSSSQLCFCVWVVFFVFFNTFHEHEYLSAFNRILSGEIKGQTMLLI